MESPQNETFLSKPLSLSTLFFLFLFLSLLPLFLFASCFNLVVQDFSFLLLFLLPCYYFIWLEIKKKLSFLSYPLKALKTTHSLSKWHRFEKGKTVILCTGHAHHFRKKKGKSVISHKEEIWVVDLPDQRSKLGNVQKAGVFSSLRRERETTNWHGVGHVRHIRARDDTCQPMKGWHMAELSSGQQIKSNMSVTGQ